MGRSRFPGKPFKFQNRKRINILSDNAFNENDSESLTDGFDASDSCFRETFSNETQNKEENINLDHDNLTKNSEDKRDTGHTSAENSSRSDEIEHKDTGQKSNIRTRSQQKMEVGKSVDVSKNMNVPVKKTVRFGRVESCDSFKPLKKLPFKPQMPLVSIIKKKSAFKLSDSSFGSILKPAKLTDLSSKISVDFSEFRARNSHSPPLRKSSVKFSSLSDARLSPPPFGDRDLKKFILPSRSIHSSRVIKPNKRFMEMEEGVQPLSAGVLNTKVLKKPKLVFGDGSYYDEAYETCDSSANSNDSADSKTTNLFREKTLGLFGSGLTSGHSSFGETFMKVTPEGETLLRHSIQTTRSAVDTPCTSDQSSNSSTSESSESETGNLSSDSDNESDLEVPHLPSPERLPATSQLSSGKLILREARLQLNPPNAKTNTGPEGPFSSFSNGPNATSNVSVSGTLTCGVCGAVKFYRFIKQARKFGIYSCESCRKFISKMLKRAKMTEGSIPPLECLSGEGSCHVPVIVRSQWKLIKCAYNARCNACWLKMCIKAFQVQPSIKTLLQAMLPTYMRPNAITPQTSMQINPLRPLSQSSALPTNVPFPRRKRNDKIVAAENQPPSALVATAKSTTILKKSSLEADKVDQEKLSAKKKNKEKSQKKESIKPPKESEEDKNNAAGRKRRHIRVKVRKKSKVDSKEADTKRQKVELKGPRVKHVCRSASIVLGQPLATFPTNDNKEIIEEPEPSIENEEIVIPKLNIPIDQCNDCDTKTDNTDKIPTLSENQKDDAASLLIKDFTNNNVDISIGKKRKGNVECVSTLKPDSQTDTEEQAVEMTHRKALKQYVSNSTNIRAYQRLKPSDKQLPEMILTDFWESYDPDEVCKTGWGLIATQPFSLMSVCFLCGSKGRDKLIFCAGCCEAYHPFCVESTSPGAASMVTASQKFTWMCPHCVLCKACNKHTTDRADTYCYNCKGFFHANCLTANLNGKYRSDWPKICSGCLKCKSCDSFKVTKFLGSLPFCSSCFRLRQKGNYCPLCQGCYQDNDFDSKMMECGWCSRWVHARCEGLSGEGYQLLSALPHNVEYICRQCLPDNPPWREMLGTYLRGKLLILLKVLAKNKDACALLKLTPHKSTPVENRLCLCESPVAVRKLMFDECPSKTTSKENTVALKEARSIQPQNSAIGNRTTSLNTDMFPHSRPLMHKITVINLQESLMQNKEICFSTGIINPDNNGRGLRDGYEMRECCVKVNDNSQSSEDENEMQVALGSDVQTSVRLVPTTVHIDKYENISDDDEIMAENLNDQSLIIHKDDQNATNVTVACLQGHSAGIECPCESVVNREVAPSLLDVKKRVNSNEYASLKEFNGDMQEAIRKTHSTDLKKIYKDTFSETFPWFDCELNCLNPDLEIKDDCDDTESLKDEDLGENLRKARNNISTEDALQEHVVPKLSTELKYVDDYLLDDSVIEDNRHCILCKITGEGQPSMEGRLLYCGQNDWIHANCALWSNEVFEEIDGSLQNVQSAIARGKTIKCASCEAKGASVSCCAKNCNTSFHFSCARKGKCAFLDDKRVFCPSHASDVKEKLQKENDFELIRPVYVELDRKRKKYNESNKVQFLLGSLTVRNLGRIVPSVSDHEDILIPIDFVCTKMYWSTKQPWKIIQYTIKTKLLLAEPLPGFDLGVNITVDHSLSSNVVDRIMAEINSWQKGLAANEHIMTKKDISPIKFRNNITMTLEDIAVKQVVEHLLDCVCRNEQQDDAPEEEPQNTADLLPPELKDAIFEDLNHDLLDGISMQDIFPKLMSYEDLIAIDLKSEYFSNEIPKESKSTDQRDDTNTKQGCENSNNTTREKNKSEGWTDSKSSGSDFLDDLLNARLEAGSKELKRSKSEVFLQNANIRGLSASRSHQRSCSLTWNCKLDSTTRTNTFKKCKLPRNLTKIDGNPISKTSDVQSGSVLDAPSIANSENDESSPILEKHWQSKQIRMIQMDGTLDSASESGSSTRSVDEDQFHASPSATPLTVNKIKEQKPQSLTDNVIDFYTKMQCSPISQLDGADDFSSSGSECASPMLSPVGRDDTDFTPIPQLDGADEVSSSGSESNSPRNPPNQVYFRANSNENVYTVTVSAANMASATEMLMRSPTDDGFLRVAQIEQTVRCDRCHCTYRNKESYDRHLPSCDMMSTSESESETPKSPETRSLNTHSFHGSFIQPTIISQQANYESISDAGKPGIITSRRTSVNTRQITINGTIVETQSPSPISSDSLYQSDAGNKTNSIYFDASKQSNVMNPQILSSQIIVNPSMPISPPKNTIGNQKMYNQQVISGPSTGLPYNICMKPTNLGNTNIQNIHTMPGNGNINHILTSAGNLHNVISSNSNQVLTIAPHQQNIAPALHGKPQTIQTFTTIPNTSTISLNGNTLQAIPTSLGNPLLQNIQPMIRPQMQNSTILMPNMNARLASPNSQQKHQIILPQCSQKSPKKQPPIQTKPLIQANPRSKGKAFTKTPTLKRQTRMDKPIQVMNQPMSLANGNIIQLQHNQSGQPSIIVQQVPNSNIMSAYVEALSQQQGQNLQYITTIGPQGDFKSTPTQFISQGGLVPQTFQIQQTENGGLVAVPSGGIPVLLPQGGVGILPQSTLPHGATILPQGSIQTQGILPQGTIQTQNGTTIIPQTAIQTQNGTTLLPQGTIHQSQGPTLLPSNSSQGPTIVPQSSMGNTQTILPQSALQSQGNTIISQPSGTTTILPQGTTILPQGIQFCNDQVLLGSTPALEMVTDSSGCMYMQVASQPVYYGLETIVQNTVMSSQQFVSTAMQGVLAQNSSFSATTTQVFQASKIEPIVEMPTGYVVVNNVPQDNIITSQANIGNTTLVSPQSLSAMDPSSSQTHKNLKSSTLPNISIHSHSDKINIPLSAPRSSTKVNHSVMGMNHPSTVGNVHNTHSNMQSSNGQPQLRCQMTPGHVKPENMMQPIRSSITSMPSTATINVAQSIANTNLVVSNCNISTISQPIVSSAITPSNVMKIPGSSQNHSPSEMSDAIQNSHECNTSSNQQIFNLPLNVQQLLRNHPGAQVWRMPATSMGNETNKQQINLQMSISQGNERTQLQKISIANSTPTTISSMSIGQNIPANIRSYNHYGQTISAESGHPKPNLPPCGNIPTSSIQASHTTSNNNINSHHMNHINVSSIGNQSLCQQFSNHATIANHSITTTASSTMPSNNQMMDVNSPSHNIQIHHQVIHNSDMDMGRQQNFQNSCNLQRHNMHAEIVNNVLNNGNSYAGQVNNTAHSEKMYPSSNSMLLENFPQSGNPQVQNIIGNNRVNCGMSNHSNGNINNHMHNVQSVTNMSQCVVSNNQSGNNFSNQSHLMNANNANQNGLNQQIHNQILSLGNNSGPNMSNNQNHICHTSNNRIHLINNSMSGNNIQMNNSSNSSNVQIGGNMHMQSSNHCNNHSSVTMNNSNQQFNGPIISHMQMPSNNPGVHNNQQHVMSTNHNVYGPSTMPNNQSMQNCVNQSEISNSVNNNQSQMTSIIHSQSQCALSNQPNMNNNNISNDIQMSNSTNNQSQSNSGSINNNLQLSNCLNIQPQIITGVNNQLQISSNMNSQSHITENIGNQQHMHNLNDHSQMSHSQNNQALISDSINNQLSGSLSNAVNNHSQITVNTQNQSSSSSNPNIQSHMINNMHNHMQMSNISHLNNQTLITSNMNNQTLISNNLMNQSQNTNNIMNPQISTINNQYPMPQATNISSQISNNVANQAHISNNLNSLNSNVASEHVHSANMENQTRMDINNSNSSIQSCNMSAPFPNSTGHSYNQNNQIQGMNNAGPMHAPTQNNTPSNQIHMSNSGSMNMHHNIQTHVQNHNTTNHVHQANNAQNAHNQMIHLNNNHNSHPPAVNSNEMGSHVTSNHNNMMAGHQLPINNNQMGSNIMQLTNQMGSINQSQISGNNNQTHMIHNSMLSRLNTPEAIRSMGNQEGVKQSAMPTGSGVIPHVPLANNNEPNKTGSQVLNDRPANIVPQTISVSNQLGYLQMNSMNNRIINLPERNQLNHSQSVANLNNQIQTPTSMNRGLQSSSNESLPTTHAFENERTYPQNDVPTIRNTPSISDETNQISSPPNNKPTTLPTHQTLNQSLPAKINNQVNLNNLVPLNKAPTITQQVPAPSNANNTINLPVHNNASTINLPVQSSSSISLPKAPTHQSGIPTNVVNPMSTRPMNRVLPIHRDAQVKSSPRTVPQASRVVPPPPPVPRNQDMPDLSIKEEDVAIDSDLEKAIEESKRTLELEEEKREAEATAAAIAASQSEVIMADMHPEPLKDRVSNELPTSETSGLKMVFHKQGESGKVYKVSAKNMKEKENKIESDSARINISAKVEQKLKRTIEGLSKSESAQILLQKKVPMRSKQLQEGHMKFKQPQGGSKPPKDDSPKMMYEITSEDGFNYSSTSLTELWTKVVDAVQKARKQHGLSPLPYSVPPNLPGTPMLAFHNNALKYLVEQLPGANRCVKYKALNGRNILTVWDTDLGLDEGFKESAAGCARASITNRKPSHDIFNWLASTHRDPPLPLNMTQDGDLAISRRFTSSTMPMAMRFRHLKETSKLAVGVYRSHIHGRGLFCRKDIDAGEMVIEYAGEVIRAVVADGRERRYESGSGRTSSRVHGCYMFRIDDRLVVDATMKGNAARFINHSCDPNCYSRVVDILGHKHIIIFALRKINQGEELTYDYKFPFEDVKIPCTCGAKKCRKYLN